MELSTIKELSSHVGTKEFFNDGKNAMNVRIRIKMTRNTGVSKNAGFSIMGFDCILIGIFLSFILPCFTFLDLFAME